MLPRIKNIIAVEPFKVKCEWTNGEIRIIDFALLQKEMGGDLWNRILQPQIFNTVKLDTIAKTLVWENELPYIDYDGTTKLGALDFCPDVLYMHSVIAA